MQCFNCKISTKNKIQMNAHFMTATKEAKFQMYNQYALTVVIQETGIDELVLDDGSRSCKDLNAQIMTRLSRNTTNTFCQLQETQTIQRF